MYSPVLSSISIGIGIGLEFSSLPGPAMGSGVGGSRHDIKFVVRTHDG